MIPVYVTCPFEFRQIFTGMKILESINILGATHPHVFPAPVQTLW